MGTPGALRRGGVVPRFPQPSPLALLPFLTPMRSCERETGKGTEHILHLLLHLAPASRQGLPPRWPTSPPGPGAPDPLWPQAGWEEDLGKPFAGAAPAVRGNRPEHRRCCNIWTPLAARLPTASRHLGCVKARLGGEMTVSGGIAALQQLKAPGSRLQAAPGRE